MLKNEIRRLVVLIRHLGEEPIRVEYAGYVEYSKALHEQYAQLRNKRGIDAVKKARKQARLAIRTTGLARAASPMPDIIATHSLNPRYIREKTALLRSRCEATPEQSHLCPRCRMRCGLPKISWHSRTLAEQAQARSTEDATLLKVYQCPHEPGNWHVGHTKNALRLMRDRARSRITRERP